jgi:Gas vesicle protein K
VNPDTDRLLRGSDDVLGAVGDELERLRALPRRLDADPEKLERGLAQLVMTVVDLLRQLMERQALRRVESGTLDDDEIERLGVAFKRLNERMDELKEIFELTDEDLNLDLGPLGRLK